MAAFNILATELRCPRCGLVAEMEAEFRFGFRTQDRYRLGDTLRWNEASISPADRRPTGGNYVGEGYVECPRCRLDFWITIGVTHDVIRTADVDLTREGFIADRRLTP